MGDKERQRQRHHPWTDLRTGSHTEIGERKCEEGGGGGGGK